MIGSLEYRDRAARLADEAFSAGVKAVLDVVYNNVSLGAAGISTHCLSEAEAERIRELRKKIHKKKAYPNDGRAR